MPVAQAEIKEIISELKTTLPEYVEQIFPSKNSSNQIKALQTISNIRTGI